MYHYRWHVASNWWSAWDTVGVVAAVIMLYCVWRLWRGMRLDAFERSIRTLCQQPHVAVSFPRPSRLAAPSSKSSGFLQISLLPLMLISTGIAILLAQTQRPDDLSRAVTWGLFVTVGTWYAIWAWPARRGVGPLRNLALAGVCSAMGISAVLWGFYMAVDFVRGDGQFTRLTASFPVLMWWCALGGIVGALVGSFRAGRIYSKTNTAEAPSRSWQAEEVAFASTPSRVRAKRWPAMLMACGASLLFHASAAPQLYREIYVQYWYWGDHRHHSHWTDNSVTLTLAPVSAPTDRWEVVVFQDTPSNNSLMYQSTSAIQTVNAPSTTVARQPVYVVGSTIKAGQLVTNNSLFVEIRAANEVPADAVTRSQALVGKYARVDLPAGAVVVGSSLYVPNNPAALSAQTLDSGIVRQQQMGTQATEIVEGEGLVELTNQAGAGLPQALPSPFYIDDDVQYFAPDQSGVQQQAQPQQIRQIQQLDLADSQPSSNQLEATFRQSDITTGTVLAAPDRIEGYSNIRPPTGYVQPDEPAPNQSGPNGPNYGYAYADRSPAFPAESPMPSNDPSSDTADPFGAPASAPQQRITQTNALPPGNPQTATPNPYAPSIPPNTSDPQVTRPTRGSQVVPGYEVAPNSANPQLANLPQADPRQSPAIRPPVPVPPSPVNRSPVNGPPTQIPAMIYSEGVTSTDPGVGPGVRVPAPAPPGMPTQSSPGPTRLFPPSTNATVVLRSQPQPPAPLTATSGTNVAPANSNNDAPFVIPASQLTYPANAPKLGVEFYDIKPQQNQPFVGRVTGGWATRFGIQTSDEILTVNGKACSIDELVKLTPQAIQTIKVRRKGKVVTLPSIAQ